MKTVLQDAIDACQELHMEYLFKENNYLDEAMSIAYKHIAELLQERLDDEKYQIVDTYVDACKTIDGDIKGAEELGAMYFDKKFFSNENDSIK